MRAIRQWRVGVVIPACNEQDTIEACLGSVITALERAEVVDFWIVVVADSCVDLTVAKAKALLGQRGEVREVAFRSAGAARREGVARILKRYEDVQLSRLWLANTDADSTVSPDWIEVQLCLANSGAAAVAGIVTLTPNGPFIAHEIYQRTYCVDEEGTHGHVHGANLAVRADAYQDAGGWSDVALAEDHCLWQRLKTKGWTLAASTRSVVMTSARLEGRAPGGFADTLRVSADALLAAAASSSSPSKR